MNFRKYFTELLGTFILVFCGTAAIVINQHTNGTVSHPGVAITFGLVVMSLIYALGNISGAHFNPAVTIAFALAGRFSWKEIIPYSVSQLAGAILASLFVKVLFPDSELLGATMPSGTIIQSFLLELFLTFFLMLVIINVATGSKEQGMFAGLAIGSVILLEAMFAGPICGASMNPARSFGPALISGHLENLWIYLVATTTGAAISIPVWKFIADHK